MQKNVLDIFNMADFFSDLICQANQQESFI